MKRDLEALKEENEILSRLASHDWLTEVLQRQKSTSCWPKKRPVSFSCLTWTSSSRSMSDTAILQEIP